MDLQTILADYLDYKRIQGCTKATVKGEKQRIQYYMKFPLKNWVNVYYKKLDSTSMITAIGRLATLNTFFKWGVKNGRFLENPFENVPVPKKPKLLPKTLNEYQVRILLSVASGHSKKAKAIYYAFLYAGLRKSEMLNMQSHHVDFHGNTLIISQGKGRKDRLVRINKNLGLILREWDNSRKNHQCFFCVSDSSLRRLKTEIQEISGVHHSLHQLRHTFASLSLESGIDLFTLQKLMGHSDIKTTAIYLSTSVDHMQEQVDKLNFS